MINVHLLSAKKSTAIYIRTCNGFFLPKAFPGQNLKLFKWALQRIAGYYIIIKSV